ncbi:MAG: thioredoxin domain-containing protein [Anaerolineae bacterium]|nr:thioredoxin domain-containing protein [Anaerolineae bacterium]
MPNRLMHESSPYLLQHADNPVDWYPWGEEALEKARREDKPIFLSIGYSACHWCHVMAHESFEDPDVAAVMNAYFVNVKVDREERPDLDSIYMAAVQALTGRGGWPMSVFLAPDGTPFFGGTYFPPEPRYGMVSFTQVLAAIADAWRHRRAELMDGGRRLTATIQQQMTAATVPVRVETLDAAVRSLSDGFDPLYGGWGGAPKFPQPMVLAFLLSYHHAVQDADILRMVTETLDKMARGGMYDQLGGGFHRYSVDAHWTVPHFEKMLYDNAQLARVYLHAWQVTGQPLYRAIATETLDYVAREMTHPAGGFYATQDADSEGEEGKFFIWTPAEIRAVLGEEAERFGAAYGVSDGGNFEGRNILEWKGTFEEREALAAARRRLCEARAQRVYPGRDEKVLVAWNGLMLAAFAEAARPLDRPDYRQIAERNADFLLRELRTPDGRLYHTWKDGAAKGNGFLEDYTHLIEGLLALYQATFDPRWVTAARELAEAVLAHFAAPDGGFYDTSDDHEALIARPREFQDNALPSGNGMAATVLAKLAGLALEPRYEDAVRHSLRQVQALLAQYPLGFAQWLVAQTYLLSRPREVAIVGEEGAWELLDVATAGYRPHQVVAAGASGVPLLEGREPLGGRATAYVCVGQVCLAPVTEPEALRQVLADVAAESAG